MAMTKSGQGPQGIRPDQRLREHATIRATMMFRLRLFYIKKIYKHFYSEGQEEI
jgi:hypothetical protein